MRSKNRNAVAGRHPDRWLTILFVLLSTILALWATPAPARDYPPLPESAQREYLLDVSDEIRITVAGLTTLSSSYVVSDDGSITLPMVDRIEARGKTTTQLQDVIANALRVKEILVSPSVNVQLAKSRPFYVLGEVKKPGEYDFRQGMNVQTAIAVAGGFTFRANQKKILITRQINGRTVIGTATSASRIQPGDTIDVRESWF